MKLLLFSIFYNRLEVVEPLGYRLQYVFSSILSIYVNVEIICEHTLSRAVHRERKRAMGISRDSPGSALTNKIYKHGRALVTNQKNKNKRKHTTNSI